LTFSPLYHYHRVFRIHVYLQIIPAVSNSFDFLIAILERKKSLSGKQKEVEYKYVLGIKQRDQVDWSANPKLNHHKFVLMT
jgi:hypothetical protein